MLLLARKSVSQILNRLSESFQATREPLLIEPATLYRMLTLWSGVYQRLHSFPVAQGTLKPGLRDSRARALELWRQMHHLAGRSPPQDLVLLFHDQYFPHLLFDLRWHT